MPPKNQPQKGGKGGSSGSAGSKGSKPESKGLILFFIGA